MLSFHLSEVCLFSENNGNCVLVLFSFGTPYLEAVSFFLSFCLLSSFLSILLFSLLAFFPSSLSFVPFFLTVHHLSLSLSLPSSFYLSPPANTLLLFLLVLLFLRWWWVETFTCCFCLSGPSCWHPYAGLSSKAGQRGGGDGTSHQLGWASNADWWKLHGVYTFAVVEHLPLIVVHHIGLPRLPW